MLPSLYTLILYITLSPGFTASASLGCTLFVVVIAPFFNFSNSCASIAGVLSTVGATPFIDVMNFLKAKSIASPSIIKSSKSSSSSWLVVP